MSGDATYSPKRRMDCDVVAREEVLENYLMGRLDEDNREAFEAHYLGCSRCFEQLRGLRDIRGELRRLGADSARETRPSYGRWASAAGLAAALVMAAGLVLWMRPTAPSLPPDTPTSPSPPRAQAPGPPRAQQPQPPSAPAPSLEQLARVQPPRYDPLTLRGTPDEATERFRQGMEHYRKADYREAINALRSAGKMDPDAAHIRFFLGISYLLIGEDAAAIERLRATLALGDTPYLEEAHFYLAKALLRQRNVAAAEKELKQVIQLQGTESVEARRLLDQLARVKNQ